MTESEKLYREIVANLQKNYPELKSSAMFGMPVFKLNGKAAGGLFGEAMNFKLTPAQVTEALKLEGAKHFDPMGGRPMKAWIIVPFAHHDKWAQLAEQSVQQFL